MTLERADVEIILDALDMAIELLGEDRADPKNTAADKRSIRPYMRRYWG